MKKEDALALVRFLVNRGVPLEKALHNPEVPADFRPYIEEELLKEQNIVLEPTRFITAERGKDWLNKIERDEWYYWPSLRNYLLTTKEWSLKWVNSLEDATDGIVGGLAPPTADQFDIRGLVLGYVQSGKTANYTAVIAKAADCGYRLIIVLSGIDNGLRLQTQRRLDKELVGSSDNSKDAVPFPPTGRQWHEFTRAELDGDFQAGNANQAALQGSQPVLMVVKKNGHVLRRLIDWLKASTDEVKRTLPVLIIDDECDLASIDTRGSYQTQEDLPPEEYNDPSTINRLIREILSLFRKTAYIAYTATPFANILIPHDMFDPTVKNDLYPKDLIVALPKPDGYFGAEELFGMAEPVTGESVEGLGVIREVDFSDMTLLELNQCPPSLEKALLCFVLAGSARAQRGQGDKPATMLIHRSMRTESHAQMKELVKEKFSELKNDWRYAKDKGIKKQLNDLWEHEFRPVTNTINPELDVSFEKIEPFIGEFFATVDIRTINSATGEVLDYEKEPNLNVIAIGGNKLSRGLTLEGLLVSFFIRSTRMPMYDTLMQMGRWFGFRKGYGDLTRIWTLPDLSEYFADLALYEHRLREDIMIYEQDDLTPLDVGMRISRHPVMQVTNRLKRRYAREQRISQSYSRQMVQTFKFPLDRLEDLSFQQDANRKAVRAFLSSLGKPNWTDKGPRWFNVPGSKTLEFLENFEQDSSLYSFPMDLVCSYISHQLALDELVTWTVAVCSRASEKEGYGKADWGIKGGNIYQVGRARRDRHTIVPPRQPKDELIGLSKEEIEQIEEKKRDDPHGPGVPALARRERSPKKGLLLLYPISKRSAPSVEGSLNRNLHENPENPLARDLVGLAISFPESEKPQPVVEYVVGSVGWGSE